MKSSSIVASRVGQSTFWRRISNVGRHAALASMLGIGGFFWIRCAAADPPASQPASSHCRMRMPPHEGTETGTNGGGSRGDNQLPAPELFAPANDTGHTISDKPVLYFYLPAGTPKTGMLTIVETKTRQHKTWAEIPLTDLSKPGVHGVDTAAGNHPLEPGVTYLWSVSVGDEADASSAYAGGFITYDSKAAAELADRVKGQSTDAQAAIFGDNGQWYDAIAALEQSIASGADSATADLRTILKQNSDYPDADHFNLVPVK